MDVKGVEELWEIATTVICVHIGENCVKQPTCFFINLRKQKYYINKYYIDKMNLIEHTSTWAKGDALQRNIMLLIGLLLMR